MGKQKVYQPEYYKKFSCIVGDCNDNCCRNAWIIMIDKVTYGKYMALEDGEREGFLKNIIVRGEEPLQAFIAFDENGLCRFLDDRGRCTIHLKYGHEFLSSVCRTYPRRICKVGNDTEAFLELSCEAAARLVLFDKGIIKFEEVVHERDDPNKYNCILAEKEYAPTENAIRIFWKLRTASIAAAQSRQYKLSARMLIIGSLIKQADELFKAGRYDEAARLGEEYLERLDSDQYCNLDEGRSAADELDVRFINELLKKLELRESALLSRCLAQAREGLGITPEGELPENIADDFHRFYDMYLADKEYILENYVVNHILTDGFPFNYYKEDSIMKNYRELLIKYNMVRFLLVGVSRRNLKFDKRRAVECVSSFSRAYDHIVGGILVMK